ASACGVSAVKSRGGRRGPSGNGGRANERWVDGMAGFLMGGLNKGGPVSQASFFLPAPSAGRERCPHFTARADFPLCEAARHFTARAIYDLWQAVSLDRYGALCCQTAAQSWQSQGLRVFSRLLRTTDPKAPGAPRRRTAANPPPASWVRVVDGTVNASNSSL